MCTQLKKAFESNVLIDDVKDFINTLISFIELDLAKFKTTEKMLDKPPMLMSDVNSVVQFLQPTVMNLKSINWLNRPLK